MKVEKSDLSRMIQFYEHCFHLSISSLIDESKRKFTLSCNGLFSETHKHSADLPNHEEMSHIAQTFRKIYGSQESTHFYKVCNYLRPRAASDLTRSVIDSERNRYSQYLKAEKNILYSDALPAPEDLVRLVMYGFYMHSDISPKGSKSVTREDVEALFDRVGKDYVLYTYAMIIFQLAAPVFTIGDCVASVLATWIAKGFELPYSPSVGFDILQRLSENLNELPRIKSEVSEADAVNSLINSECYKSFKSVLITYLHFDLETVCQIIRNDLCIESNLRYHGFDLKILETPSAMVETIENEHVTQSSCYTSNLSCYRQCWFARRGMQLWFSESAIGDLNMQKENLRVDMSQGQVCKFPKNFPASFKW